MEERKIYKKKSQTTGRKEEMAALWVEIVNVEGGVEYQALYIFSYPRMEFLGYMPKVSLQLISKLVVRNKWILQGLCSMWC